MEETEVKCYTSDIPSEFELGYTSVIPGEFELGETSIDSLKTNPSNPRFIKDDKFKKLVKSIKEAPWMLKIRPIVVDANLMVLGGNMRLQACREAGLTEVSVVVASRLTEEQKKEFIIKDNVGYGEWDLDLLANEWDIDKLNDWGLEISDASLDILDEEQTDSEKDTTGLFCESCGNPIK